ncbi:MAG: PAS domain S-box protein [Campylobacterota bacterium]|nr:PAS domain S-box protein [Campylobacterota bacterium]
MKGLDTSALQNRVTLYIVIAMIILSIMTVYSTLYTQKSLQLQREQNFFAMIDRSISHVMKHYLKDYHYHLKEILLMTGVASKLQAKDREGMYKELLSEWNLLREEEPNLNAIQIHNSDGTSFLRMHQSDAYGDEIAKLRPMLREIHANHQTISGYETGRFATVYRIIAPIFNDENKYLGAFELGINPNFLLNAIYDIHAFTGLMFIKEEDLALYGKAHDITIDGYRLQSDLTPQTKALYWQVIEKGALQNNVEFTIGDKCYLSHLFELNDFKGQPKVKLLFFQDISHVKAKEFYSFKILLIFMLIVLSLVSWLIYRRIGAFQHKISSFYQSYIQDQHEIIKFKQIIEKSPVSMVITDAQGKIEYVNPQFSQMTGYSLEEAIENYPNILKPDLHSDSDHQMIWKESFKNIKKNGEEYWESAIVSPIHNNKGVVTNYIGIKQDITKEVYLKEELKDKEELMIAQSRHAAMGEMIGMIAHQWRQPISVIAMGVNNMIADIDLDEVDIPTFREEFLKLIQQTQHLSKTIDDFRNFFRPDKERELVSVLSVLQETLEIVEASFANSNIIIDVNNSAIQDINIYSRELLQVFLNLLNNAKEALIEYQSKERYIWCDISETDDSTIIKISDNGGGIDVSALPKIFEPYFSTKDEKHGTGIGLYMSKIIIEKHLLGSIGVKNSNEGACFTITLPLEVESG